MENHTHKDPNSKVDRPDDPELDLYTIPSYSSWFSWDNIHETERIALKEFFCGNSISRSPKIYKEYRDFIINKFREDPSRRLTFSEVRKSLVGDVSLLHKVFLFFEKWGLINFGLVSVEDDSVVDDDKEGTKVVIEEGAPNGIRVVELPNSLKPISVSSTGGNTGQSIESGFKLPPLASYSDAFGDLMKQKRLVCGNCGEICDSEHYEFSKQDNLSICKKCFNDENFMINKSKDEFKLCDFHESSGNEYVMWTETDILLLLESVLKHGDDWDLVAENFQTKSKLDCISKLLEMPFGELIFGSSHGKGDSIPNGNTENTQQVQHSSSQNQETANKKDQCHVQTIEDNLDTHAVNQDPPSKRLRISSLSDASSSLMKQVTHLSSMVGPHITAAAADAAVTALCSEYSCSREIFDGEDDDVTNVVSSPTLTSNQERTPQVEDSDMQVLSTQLEREPSNNDIPQTLRIRAATATALGATAARAKLLAEQEDKEIEHLVATIIETQLKKLQCKVKHFEDLELIAKKEYDEMEELKEYIVEERIDVVQRIVSAGISRWKDHACLKPQPGNMF